MTSSVTRVHAQPAELVRLLLDADARHDLDRYRALLDDEFVERTEGEITSNRGDDAAHAAARSWALSPSASRQVDDINEVPGFVTVRYRLDRAVPVGLVPREQPGNFVGYSIYETREGHIIRAAHYLSEQREQQRTPADESVPAASTRRRYWRRALGGLTVLLSLLLTEPVWAAPVVATTAWRGAALAFAVFAPLYFALGYGVSLLVIRRAKTRDANGRFERLLRGEADRRYLRRVRRLVRAGTLIGFVLSSMLFGSFITTWLLLQFGRRRHIRRDAMVSSLIFSVWFVGFYAGLASLIF